MNTSTPVLSEQDKERLATIYEDFLEKITRFIWTKLPPQAKCEAEDIAQEVFVRACRHIDRLLTLPDKKHIARWLCCIAKNMVTDYVRHGTCLQWESLEKEEELFGRQLYVPQDFERQVEEMALLQGIIAGLSPTHIHSLACALAGVREYTIIEGMTPIAAKMRLTRARRAFRIRHQEVNA